MSEKVSMKYCDLHHMYHVNERLGCTECLLVRIDELDWQYIELMERRKRVRELETENKILRRKLEIAVSHLEEIKLRGFVDYQSYQEVAGDALAKIKENERDH